MSVDFVEFRDAIERSGPNRTSRNFPGRQDDRYVDGCLFPRFTPKFAIDFSKPLKVFTIGSCFARNIETFLKKSGFELPTLSFQAPSTELAGAPNVLLNEYSPATMAQRIRMGLRGESFPLESIVPSGEQRFADLLLPGVAQKPKYDVTYERALERRMQVDKVYEELGAADLVILTLGFVETWYDSETKLFLNRLPPLRFASANPGRFHFSRLNAAKCVSILDEALVMLADLKINVILTVSPVPLHTTFSTDDCVVANEYSKSALRVCAEELRLRHENVDYFPSYEIVRSGGLSNFIEDNIHVEQRVVDMVVDYMISMYSVGPQI